MSFYLEALDRDLKKSPERPSISVLLCATKDNEVVELSATQHLSTERPHHPTDPGQRSAPASRGLPETGESTSPIGRFISKGHTLGSEEQARACLFQASSVGTSTVARPATIPPAFDWSSWTDGLAFFCNPLVPSKHAQPG